jgi:glycosidase
MANHFPSVSWSRGASMYEINIRQYSVEGTFKAFQQHLPRLKNMGIDILWFMPITPISLDVRQGTLGSYYACSSYVEINPEFGTLNDFKALVVEAHSLGMKVIIDWVANHTGWDHEWTKTNKNYYLLDEQGNFTERNGWHDVIDLNYQNQHMRTAMIAAMQYWVNTCNIDGFRCDMAHLVPLDFWQEARTQCDALKPLFWLAECEDVQYHNVFDVTYAWEWMHVTEKFFQGNASLHHVFDVLHKYTQYPKDSRKLFFTTNHDENSWNGTEYEKFGDAAKAMAVFAATWSGMSLVYSGQENPNLKRLKFFDKDVIEWNQPLQLFDFYKTILQLSKSKVISLAETFILPTQHEGVMGYLRKHENEVVLVLLNFTGASKLQISVEHNWLNNKFVNAFSKLDYNFKQKEVFELQAYEYLVYATNNG